MSGFTRRISRAKFKTQREEGVGDKSRSKDNMWWPLQLFCVQTGKWEHGGRSKAWRLLCVSCCIEPELPAWLRSLWVMWVNWPRITLTVLWTEREMIRDRQTDGWMKSEFSSLSWFSFRCSLLCRRLLNYRWTLSFVISPRSKCCHPPNHRAGDVVIFLVGGAQPGWTIRVEEQRSFMLTWWSKALIRGAEWTHSYAACLGPYIFGGD